MHDRDELISTSAFDFARDMIKALTLVNGGAALSLLTFYGSLSNKSTSSIVAHDIKQAAFFGLLRFAIGVLFSLVSGSLGYLTQLQWGVVTDDFDQKVKSANSYHIWALICAVLSVLVFVMGIGLSGTALFLLA